MHRDWSESGALLAYFLIQSQPLMPYYTWKSEWRIWKHVLSLAEPNPQRKAKVLDILRDRIVWEGSQ